MNKLNRLTFNTLVERQSIRKANNDRASEITSLEPLVMFALSMYQDDHGRVDAINYKEICEITGLSPAALYSTLESLQKPVTGKKRVPSPTRKSRKGTTVRKGTATTVDVTVPAMIRVEEGTYAGNRGDKAVIIINNINVHEKSVTRPSTMSPSQWATAHQYVAIDQTIIDCMKKFLTRADRYHVAGKYKAGREMLIALDFLYKLRLGNAHYQAYQKDVREGKKPRFDKEPSRSYYITIEAFLTTWGRDLGISDQTLRTYFRDIKKVFSDLKLNLYTTDSGLIRLDPDVSGKFYKTLVNAEEEKNAEQEYRTKCAERSVRQLGLKRKMKKHNKKKPESRFSDNRIEAAQYELVSALADYKFETDSDNRRKKKDFIIRSKKIPEAVDQVSLMTWLLEKIFTQDSLERLQRRITPSFLQAEIDKILNLTYTALSTV